PRTRSTIPGTSARSSTHRKILHPLGQRLLATPTSRTVRIQQHRWRLGRTRKSCATREGDTRRPAATRLREKKRKSASQEELPASLTNFVARILDLHARCISEIFGLSLHRKMGGKLAIAPALSCARRACVDHCSAGNACSALVHDKTFNPAGAPGFAPKKVASFVL